MRNRVERLRIWLLGGAIFLLLVIASFLVAARTLRRHRMALPARLGINIVRETDGYTYTQTVQGRTVFTIHASKSVERSDGKIALHDVSIALYGEKQDRNDRISGDDFEYDEKAGVFRSTGVVHIDLQAKEDNQEHGGKTVSSSVPKVLHVTTSGLVYVRDLGVVATSQPLEFVAGTMTGHATGADYSTDTGILVLHSAVSMNGMAGTRPLQMTAAMAQVDNRNQEIFLTGARGVSLGQTVEAQRATLHTRPDGTLSQVEAQGNVTREAKGSKLVAQKADVVLNAKSQPQSAVLTEGVQYSSTLPLLQRSGQAQKVNIAFDAQGQAQKAVFTGAVHMNERIRETEAAREPWNSRDLTAGKVVATLVPVDGGTVQVRDIEATGNARMTADNRGTLASSKNIGTEEMSADVLTAHLVVTGDGTIAPKLDTVAGRGHTLLHQVNADGIERTSTGDMLDAKFRASPDASGIAGRQTSASVEGGALVMLDMADQRGHVKMIRRVPARKTDRQVNTTDEIEQATAQRAIYDGNPGSMMLTGNVQLSQPGSSLWANEVTFSSKTGDALASGAVKVDYVQYPAPSANKTQASPAEPTHIDADRAEFVHTDDTATFYGMPARLWQGGSQVQAQVIEVDRAKQRLTAHGGISTGGATAMQTVPVHTLLVSTGRVNSNAAVGGVQTTTAAKATAAKPGKEEEIPKVMRIDSDELVYSDILQQADFNGSVYAETVDGTVRANHATVYMQQSSGQGIQPAAEQVPSIAGNVERMVATGQVQIEQPGRRATGDRLLYSAGDQLFVLIGDARVPPKMVDAQRGTITGAAITFHSGDKSVVVSNTVPGAPSVTPEKRVHTETHTDKDATIKSGK